MALPHPLVPSLSIWEGKTFTSLAKAFLQQCPGGSVLPYAVIYEADGSLEYMENAFLDVTSWPEIL